MNGTMAAFRFKEGRGGPFYQEIRDRVDDHFAATGKTRLATPGIWAKAAFYLTIALAAYTLILFGEFGLVAMLLLAITFGLATFLLAINVGHDGAHSALARSRWINDVVFYFTYALIGGDPYSRGFRHVCSHHIFPNVYGCDIDLASNWLMRLSPQHPRRWHQRYQHLYAPFVYSTVTIYMTLVQDLRYLFKRRLANTVDIPHPISSYVSFVLSKFAYLTVVVVIPVLVLPIPAWQVLIGVLIMNLITSSTIMLLVVGNHLAEETEFPVLGEDGTIPLDWATHAMLTSLDWNPTNRIACFISGGANLHAAHHLFPNVSHAHYPAITRVLADTSAKFGVPYNVTTFSRMIGSHFRFLKRMGVAEPYAKA